jgi:predicted dehydrogenase
MIGIGVIGYGYWGPNLVRNFADLATARVAAVCDTRRERLAAVERRYPGVHATTDPAALIADPAVDAVAVATPVQYHFELAMAALRAGKHVLVEKPIASTSDEARRLVDEAARRRLTLMVDHTFVYTGAVTKMRELTQAGELGEIYYYDSVRINLGLFQHDVNVLWDLAVHDLSIMDYVLQRQPTAVSATGLAHVPGQPENIAYMTIFFDGPLIAHVHANWLAPVKVRRTLLGGSRRMIVFDDLEASEKIKVYDRGISVDPSPQNVYQMLVGYRTGDMWAPKLAVTEALAVEAAHFVDCVAHATRPLTDGEAGVRVVRLLEAATESMMNQGRLVALDGMPHQKIPTTFGLSS